MPLRITKTARFYYLELYVLEEFPPAPDFSRAERKLVRELQRQQNRTQHPRYPRIVPVLTQQGEDLLTVLTAHGTAAYKKLVREAKILTPLI